MSQLTETQQQALNFYRQTGELGILSNILIEDCLEELESNEGKLGILTKYDKICIYEEGSNTFSYFPFKDLGKKEKIYIIQTLLSRTPDGHAVMPFLDVESKEYIENYNSLQNLIGYSLEESEEKLIENTPKTLDHKLYQEFTEALRTGKSFESALEIITKIYLTEIYV